MSSQSGSRNPRTFDRAKSIYPRSLAARSFRVDMSTVNAYFWVGRLAEGGLVRALKPLDDNADPVIALGVPSSYDRRLGHSVAALEGMTKTFSQWRRLLVLVMMAAAFEKFITTASRLSVESDPLLQSGFPKIVDGARLKKHGLQPAPRDLAPLVLGEWSKRRAFFESTFGMVPDDLSNSVSDLEYVRRTRNQVAHALGVDDGFGRASTDEPSAAVLALVQAQRPDMLPQVRVSEDRLIHLMGVMQRCVDAIDQQLLINHLGSYELIANYLEWKKSPDVFERRAGVDVRGHRRDRNLRFRYVMGELFGAGLGAPYVKELESYVRSL